MELDKELVSTLANVYSSIRIHQSRMPITGDISKLQGLEAIANAIDQLLIDNIRSKIKSATAVAPSTEEGK
jgi:CII-binding regulator of phage lambda lysogenization HflD